MYETETFIEQDELLDKEPLAAEEELDEELEEPEEDEEEVEGADKEVVVQELSSPYRFDGTEIVNVHTGESWTKEFQATQSVDMVAQHHQMLRQWRDGGDPRFFVDEVENGGKLHTTYMILNKDWSVGYEIVSRPLDHGAEEEATSADEEDDSAASEEETFEELLSEVDETDNEERPAAPIEMEHEATVEKPEAQAINDAMSESHEVPRGHSATVIPFSTTPPAPQTTGHDAYELNGIIMRAA